MVPVFIALGSNRGDQLANCLRAVEELRCQPGFTVVRVSSWYRTEPLGPVDQDWFVNGVVWGETELSTEELLGVLMGIEERLGRVRGVRWGPRTLDLDILLYGDDCVDSPRLTVPHPRLHERRFVLVPLVELDPRRVHPHLGVSVEELLARLPQAGQRVERLGDP
jgi:2-amino-4-hydroxy-6-hydroxymethyldihydropteridine diphosphokinase